MVATAVTTQVEDQRGLIHARPVAEDRGIDEDDISHRQERSNSGDDFSANVGPACLQVEQ